MSSSAKENHVTDISDTARSRKTDAIDLPEAPKAGAITPGASMIEISQILAQLCDKALTAEECTLEANQEEILCWYHYGGNLVFQEKALCDKNKIGEKKAKGLIYDEVVRQLNILRKKRSQDTGSPLPDISRDSLRKKTQRAVKIYKLFEKVGIDKVKYIRSYSANEISKFTNDEIQTIIDHFTEKPNIDFTDDPEGTPAEERTDEMVRAEAVNTDEVIGVTSEVNVSTTSIPSTHEYDEIVDEPGDSDYDEPTLIGTSKEVEQVHDELTHKEEKLSDLKMNASEVLHAPIKISKFPEDREIILETVHKRFPFLSWTKSIIES